MNDTPAPQPSATENARFQKTLSRVLIVQVVALTLLGVLQALYNR